MNINNKNVIKSLVLLMLIPLSGSLLSCSGVSNGSSMHNPRLGPWEGSCYTGSQAPKMYLGDPYDFYVETIDGDIHVKVTDDKWEQISNIKNLPFILKKCRNGDIMTKTQKAEDGMEIVRKNYTVILDEPKVYVDHQKNSQDQP